MYDWLAIHRRRLQVIIGAVGGFVPAILLLTWSIANPNNLSLGCGLLGLVMLPAGVYLGGLWGCKFGDEMWWWIEGRSWLWLRYLLVMIAVLVGAVFMPFIFIFLVYSSFRSYTSDPLYNGRPHDLGWFFEGRWWPPLGAPPEKPGTKADRWAEIFHAEEEDPAGSETVS